MNFLNRNNAADQRVYKLLDEKFKLFNGVFGASDEVLGAIESGVDFEKRIVGIYQKCRTPQQIEFEFDQLQTDLESQIGDKKSEAHEQLLNNFDQEVIEKVRVTSGNYLNRFEEWLWEVTKFFLASSANFSSEDRSFELARNPFEGERIHPGPYRLGKRVEDVNTYRIGHPLAQRILTSCKALPSEPGEILFDYSGSKRRITSLAILRGKAGWLTCVRVGITAFETEDHLLFAGVNDDGDFLEPDQCRRMFDVDGETTVHTIKEPDGLPLQQRIDQEHASISEHIIAKNGAWFDVEMDKLDRWAEDRRRSLKVALEDLDASIREKKKEARSAPNLPAKLELQRQLRQMEGKRDEAWKEFDLASRDIEHQKDSLLDEISQRLNKSTEREELFTIRWRLA